MKKIKNFPSVSYSIAKIINGGEEKKYRIQSLGGQHGNKQVLGKTAIISTFTLSLYRECSTKMDIEDSNRTN